ncbi:MAG: adenylate kinase [Phycisphaeraceae bacterium]|nr:MAG: adenylate kinase [Phycisphaeraceae bacterium]
MPDKKYQTILLFGAPGAGKGTQGSILATVPGFHHISTGDMFRTLDLHSDLGKVFYEHSSKGDLVPDEVTIELWKQYAKAQSILGVFKPYEDLLVLDGVPRTTKQAELMEEYVDVLEVVHLVCHDMDAMIKRLRRRALRQNRADDAREDVIRNRFQVYLEETRPVLEYYPADIVREVDAVGSPGAVLQHILEVVVPVQEAHFKNQLDD